MNRCSTKCRRASPAPMRPPPPRVWWRYTLHRCALSMYPAWLTVMAISGIPRSESSSLISSTLSGRFGVRRRSPNWLLHFAELGDDYGLQFLFASQDGAQLRDQPLEFRFNSFQDFLALHLCEAVQLEVENGARLAVGKIPAFDQSRFGFRGRFRFANQLDDFVKMIGTAFLKPSKICSRSSALRNSS